MPGQKHISCSARKLALPAEDAQKFRSPSFGCIKLEKHWLAFKLWGVLWVPQMDSSPCFMVQATVLAALATLGHVAARPALAGAVFGAEDGGADCPSVVAAALQHYRDCEARAHLRNIGWHIG